MATHPLLFMEYTDCITEVISGDGKVSINVYRKTCLPSYKDEPGVPVADLNFHHPEDVDNLIRHLSEARKEVWETE